MYVCNCAGVTQRQVRQAVNDGATTVKQLKSELGLASGCGQCACDARELIFDTMLANATATGAAATGMAVSVGQPARPSFA